MSIDGSCPHSPSQDENRKEAILFASGIFVFSDVAGTHIYSLSLVGTVSLLGIYHCFVFHHRHQCSSGCRPKAKHSVLWINTSFSDYSVTLIWYIKHNRNPMFFGCIFANQNSHTREVILQLWSYHIQLDKKALFPKARCYSRDQGLSFPISALLLKQNTVGDFWWNTVLIVFLWLFCFLILFLLLNLLRKDACRG